MSLKEFELFRLMPSSTVTVETVASGGGSLITGAYQFSYRLIDSYSGRSTKFSLFTHPVMISSSDSSGDKYGNISSITDKSIEISFNVTNEEVALYDTYQIAVIESNSSNGQSDVVSLSRQIALTPSKNKYKYDSNKSFDRIGIEEASIDDASIETFKTIAFKGNRLIGGNVRYKDLFFDNGNPIVSSGQIISKKIPVAGNTDKSTSESKGYFLDEVYRFYVSFWDEYGDFSFPFALNMSNVVGNEAKSFNGFKDMRFPKRSSDNPIIETLEASGDEHTLTINRGLSITISNIPSWAKGFVVLRAKRKKGVLFQSPLIPTTIVQSPDAEAEYPGEDAQAPSPLGTILPKNMALSLNKGIVRKEGTDSSFVDWSANYEDFDFCKKIHVAFPPEAIFNNSGVPYVDFIKKERINIESVDYCFLNQVTGDLLSRNKSIESGSDFSNDGSRATSLSLFAPTSFNYASKRLTVQQFKDQIEACDRTMTDEVSSMYIVPSDVSSIPIVGLSKGAPTSDFGNHGDLKISPDGPQNGTTPSNQRMFVLTTKEDRPDISYYGVGGVKAGYSTSNIISGQNPSNGNPTTIDPNNIRDVLGEESNPPYSAINSFLEIVNFRTNLGDDRYGDPVSQQEIVSTGSYSTITTGTQSATVDVFGGDCFISPFTFKVHDSHYAVVNSDQWGDEGKAWGKSFKDSSEKEIRRPFPYKSLGVNIGVFLESEVNSLYAEELTKKGRDGIYNQVSPIVSSWSGTSVKGDFYSYQNRIYRGLVNDSSGVTPSESVGYIYEDLGENLNGTFYQIKETQDVFYISKTFNENKIPLSYLYNPDYSIQDQSKPFPIIYSPDSVNRINFSARMVYSDPGIFQTNIEGFNRFRVANIYDLEESEGSITKLISHKGNLYGIQEGSFCYIPFETSLIETSDGTSLSVQSGQVVGRPQYIENHGSSYIRSVISTPKGLMFADINNSKIIIFNDGVSYLNDLGVSSYIQNVSSSLRALKTSEKDVHFYYDYSVDDTFFRIKDEALVLGPTNNVKTILAPSIIEGVNSWQHSIYNNSDHFLIGDIFDESTDERKMSLTKINSLSGSKTMLGKPFGSNIEFVVNQEDFHTRVFYLVKFLASKQELAKIESFSNNLSNGVYSATTEPDRQAGFLLNKIREKSDNSRVRGEYAVIGTSVSDNEIKAALTKVRSSYRII